MSYGKGILYQSPFRFRQYSKTFGSIICLKPWRYFLKQNLWSCVTQWNKKLQLIVNCSKNNAEEWIWGGLSFTIWALLFNNKIYFIWIIKHNSQESSREIWLWGFCTLKHGATAGGDGNEGEPDIDSASAVFCHFWTPVSDPESIISFLLLICLSFLCYSFYLLTEIHTI